VVDWNKDVELSGTLGQRLKDGPSQAFAADAASAPMPGPETSTSDEPQLAPEMSPAPAVTPAAPVGPTPTAPALEIPPVATVAPAANPVPWYKRELSFGKKSDGGKLETKQRKRAKEPKEKKPRGGHVPFYKRELSFGKKSDAGKLETKQLERAKEPKEKKLKSEQVPFYKRELTFGGKSSRGPKAAKATQGKSQKASQLPKRLKRVTGLKIGASQLAAAQVHNNGGPELVQIARQELAPGVIVGGELRDPDALADALKDFFKRHKLPRQGVRLGLANNRIGVRIFEIGGIDDVKQLENAIRFRAHEALPIPIEEAVIDWQVLDEREDEDGGVVRRILLVVAYRDLVDRYVSACTKAGIKLVGIDLEAFALLRVLAEPLPPEAGPAHAATVVVAVGHDRSTFAVSDGRVCEFSRVLDWGGSTLNVAIARELDIAPSEAEEVKRALSMIRSDTPEGLTDDQADRVREAVRRQLESFARELVSSLQFYQNQAGSLGIGEIVLTGGTAHLHGLAEELHRLIGVSVRPGDPLARVKVGKKIKDAEQIGSLAIAIGLGIED
jgi:type IV pilus assembly protein PilM